MNIHLNVTMICFAFLTVVSSALCQDVDRQVVRAVTKATASGIDFHKECHQPVLFSSIVVSFKENAEVDTVLFSGLPKCIEAKRKLLEGNVEKRVNDLSLPKESYANKFIVIVCAFVLGETSNVSDYNISLTEWTRLFDELDVKSLENKQLKEISSTSVTIFPTIKN